MARPLRIEYEGAIHHVMNRGIARRDLFRDVRDGERFLASLEDAVGQYQVRLYAFCLMPNHYHLLVETPHANLGRFIHSVQTSYAVYFNLRHRTSGHVYEGPYKPKLVEGDDYLLRLSRYIHLNPIETKALSDKQVSEKVKALREYAWSSYPGYIGKREREDWVAYGPMERLIRERFGRQKDAYRNFVERGLVKKDADLDDLMKNRLAVGSGGFLEAVGRMYKERREGHRIPEDVSFRRTGVRVSSEKILSEVCKELGVDRKELKRRRGSGWMRGLAARMLLQYGGLTQREAAQLLGMGTGAAVCIRVRQLARSLETDKKLQRQENRIGQVLSGRR
jgi:REP element-mobilizing transposase RayT